ncbi:hypothetical protein HGRIS_005409 [Hohenbuehelia grisea]|uniref:Uncharacterized protein n=1 Tax=Hohenbuehelia grisea TaxID=104357 RepID=A0ABR3JGE5_9AGAR
MMVPSTARMLISTTTPTSATIHLLTPTHPFGVDAGTETWLKSDRDYTYPELLTCFCTSHHATSPDLLPPSLKRYMIATPSVHREGSNKSIFDHVTDICKRASSARTRLDTLLTQENRIFFMSCKSCGFKRSVNTSWNNKTG